MSGETLRDRLATVAAHQKLPWTRTTEHPILDPDDVAEMYAVADANVAVVADWLRAEATTVRTYPRPAALGETPLKAEVSNLAIEMHARGLELLADDLTPTPAESTEGGA